MTLLDRFRTQPQRDPDPAVRLAYLAELPLTERDQIVAAAREDTDARVRKAAVAKLLDPPALAAIARDDADASVRDAALAMLRDIALDAFEGVDESGSLAAVDALHDARTLAQIAKTSLRESVARQALSRIDASGASAMASIARQAELEPIRQLAFDRLSDRADFLAVALNCDFKETAQAAVDRLSERDDLEQIAERARNKAAGKRARQILRERDDAAAQAAADAEGAAAAEAATRDMVQQAARDEAARTEAEARRVADAEAAAQQRGRELEQQQAESAAGQGAQEHDAVAQAASDARREAAQAAAQEAAAREAERRRINEESEAKARRDALNRMNQLLGRVEALIQKDDLSLKAADRALRDVRAAVAAVPPLPSRQDFEHVSERLKAAQEALGPRVRDLREVADWQRWANVGIQEQLCEKMEALREEADGEAIARRIHELQQQWRLAADVPRPQGESLWKRFKAAHDELWARCEAHFASQAEARAENLAKKVVLCERAEALAGSSNWVQTAEEIKGLQAQWKAIGPVTRGQEKAVWERFRAACDRFFTRRQDDLAKRKVMWSDNFARKEALCLKVEALAESTEWEQTSAEIRRLQAEWKAIGAVKKSRSDAIWQRFRAGCDKFFARYASRHDIAKAERVAAREAICAELEGLEGDAASESQAAPADLALTVRGLRNKWQQELVARGVDRDQAAALDRRYADACRRLIARWPAAFAGTDLDPETNRKRMETIVKRMEDLAASLKGPGEADVSPTEKLANMLKEALAANTIGGKADPEARRRSAQDDVRQAQASWSRVGPVPDDARQELTDRFQRAIRQISGR
jgi:Domain of Unknown Function (DUF349)